MVGRECACREVTLEKRENFAPNLEVAKALMSASHLLSCEPNCPREMGNVSGASGQAER